MSGKCLAASFKQLSFFGHPLDRMTALCTDTAEPTLAAKRGSQLLLSELELS